MIAALFGILLLFSIGFIVLAVFFLLNLQGTLIEVNPKNRKVAPSNVWLMLIPFFNFYYAFILYPKISESLRLEYENRGIEDGGDYGAALGMILAFLSIVVAVMSQLEEMQVIGGFIGLAHMIILIAFWVKMARYKNNLRIFN